MSELPVPVASPPELPKPQTLVCANCHADLVGEYCAACGQRHEPHIHTVAHFAGEAFESISHADSRLWRTLWYLFARPGFLTKEFFAGRRVKYLPPFRLYLVMSVVFFTVFGLGGRNITADIDVGLPTSPAEIAATRAVADEIAALKNGALTDEQRTEIAARLRAIADQQAAKGGASPADAAPSAASPGSDKEYNLNLNTGEGVREGIERFCTDFREGAAGDKAPVTDNQKSVKRWCQRFADEGMGAVGTALAHNIPKAMFVFLPLLALCMQLIYWRPRHYYVEHLLFLIHNHTAVFLVMTAVMLVGLIPFVGDYAWPLYWAAFIYMAWYMYRGMRTVYRQGRALTALKYFTLVTAYLSAGFAVFLLTLVYSALTF